MRSRQDIPEIFATFLQFETDYLSGWVWDAKLRRSIQNCLLKFPQDKSENFWAVYWHKSWLSEPNSINIGHLSAYLQESCYWAAKRTMPQFASVQCSLSDCFQIAIASVPKILKACDPDLQASLKSYSSTAFGNIIRDGLRQKQEIDFCSDWGLLLKTSRKRLQEALENAGFNSEIIKRYLLAWTCFEDGYIQSKSSKNRKLQRPDEETWELITQNYNRAATQLNSSEPEPTANIEKWLLVCAKTIRAYLYPTVSSLNVPKPGQGERELQDDLPSGSNESLLANLIEEEEAISKKNQQTELSSFLVTTLKKLDIESQQILDFYYRQKLTQQQIAKQLEIPQYKISRRLSRARELLLVSITKWSQEKLHISPTTNVVKHISAVLEDWLQDYFHNLDNQAN
jgi:RNA polymerase sigma factor (sigma-70 family)